MKSPLSVRDREYQAEDDHRTLMRAAEVQGNRPRMLGAQRYQAKQTKALSMVQRLFGKGRSMSKGSR